MSDDETTLDTKKLDQLLKAIKNSKDVRGRVGILGDKNSRSGAKGTVSNAAIGHDHEFGNIARGLPVRSFLRVPITDLMQERLEAAGGLDKDTVAAVIRDGSVVAFNEKVVLVAEDIVLGAFATRGYGKWKAWSPGYENNTGQVLVDTHQLRDSITSEVKK